MDYPKHIWQQLKNLTSDELISALLKDGYVLDEPVKTERIYRHSSGRKVSIHYHKSSQCFGPGLLKVLLEDIGWSQDDMRKLKLIK